MVNWGTVLDESRIREIYSGSYPGDGENPDPESG